MTNLSSLREENNDKSREELLDDLAKIRSSRRNFAAKTISTRKEKSTKKAIDGASLEELKELLKTLEDSE